MGTIKSFLKGFVNFESDVHQIIVLVLLLSLFVLSLWMCCILNSILPLGVLAFVGVTSIAIMSCVGDPKY